MASDIAEALRERFSGTVPPVLRRVERAVIATAAGLVRIFPPRWVVQIRDRLRFRTRMDYPRHPIALHVETLDEYDLRLISCQKEPETVAWIEETIRDGDVFYDIGANVGAYALIAAKCGQGKAAVYAFEPSFSTFAQLCRNIFANACERSIVPLPVALSDRTGMAAFHYVSLESGSALHGIGATRQIDGTAGPPSSLQLPTLTYALDDLIDQFRLPIPSHVKLDVDGTELSILRGARSMLGARVLRTALVEISQEAGNGEAIMELLKEHGLVLQQQHWHDKTRVWNYIFVRS